MVPDMDKYEKASKVLLYIILTWCVGFMALIFYAIFGQ